MERFRTVPWPFFRPKGSLTCFLSRRPGGAQARRPKGRNMKNNDEYSCWALQSSYVFAKTPLYIHNPNGLSYLTVCGMFLKKNSSNVAYCIRDIWNRSEPFLLFFGKKTGNRSEPFLSILPKIGNSSGIVLNRSEPFLSLLERRTILNRSPGLRILHKRTVLNRSDRAYFSTYRSIHTWQIKHIMYATKFPTLLFD